MNTVQFGSDSEHVRITLPDSYSIKGWAEADVEIAVQGFQGKLAPWVESADFGLFASQLRVLYESLEGKAELRPMEGQFILTLTASTLGHVKVSGEAWSHATYGTKLKFEFELDQSYLGQPLSELERVQATAPAFP
jgi:hypothetical protein